jgi:hypothetical protein
LNLLPFSIVGNNAGIRMLIGMPNPLRCRLFRSLPAMRDFGDSGSGQIDSNLIGSSKRTIFFLAGGQTVLSGAGAAPIP